MSTTGRPPRGPVPAGNDKPVGPLSLTDMNASGDNFKIDPQAAGAARIDPVAAQGNHAGQTDFSSRQVEFPSRRWLRQATEQVRRRAWWRLFTGRPDSLAR